MDVDGLAEVLPNRVLAEWIEFKKQHPFGDDWEQAGSIIAATLTPHSKQKLTADKFIPRVKTKRESQQEVTRGLDELKRRFGG